MLPIRRDGRRAGPYIHCTCIARESGRGRCTPSQ